LQAEAKLPEESFHKEFLFIFGHLLVKIYPFYQYGEVSDFLLFIGHCAYGFSAG
jgi:hypothetical protein